jgi:hypothetical protein
MTKSPFEIRADLIKLAQEHLEKQYMANLKFATESHMRMVEAGMSAVDAMPKVPYFTAEDILKQAKEFYSFVSTK